MRTRTLITTAAAALVATFALAGCTTDPAPIPSELPSATPTPTPTPTPTRTPTPERTGPVVESEEEAISVGTQAIDRFYEAWAQVVENPGDAENAHELMSQVTLAQQLNDMETAAKNMGAAGVSIVGDFVFVPDESAVDFLAGSEGEPITSFRMFGCLDQSGMTATEGDGTVSDGPTELTRVSFHVQYITEADADLVPEADQYYVLDYDSESEEGTCDD